MNPTRFLFVRHGETTWNKSHLLQGSRDIPLSANGKRQAHAVAEALKDFPIDALYSSPLSRAFFTAQAISKHHPGIPIVRHPDILEQDFGEYEGKPYEQATLLYQNGSWEESWLYPDRRVMGGESLHDVETRLHRFFRQALRKHRGKTIAVVSHGNAIRIALTALVGLPFPYLNTVRLGNTAISMIEYDGKIPGTVLFINFHGHLKESPLS